MMTELPINKKIYVKTLPWELLTKTVKSESGTRWSTRIQALRFIVDELENLELLQKLTQDKTTTSDTRSVCCKIY